MPERFLLNLLDLRAWESTYSGVRFAFIRFFRVSELLPEFFNICIALLTHSLKIKLSVFTYYRLLAWKNGSFQSRAFNLNSVHFYKFNCPHNHRRHSGVNRVSPGPSPIPV